MQVSECISAYLSSLSLRPLSIHLSISCIYFKLYIYELFGTNVGFTVTDRLLLYLWF